MHVPYKILRYVLFSVQTNSVSNTVFVKVVRTFSFSINHDQVIEELYLH
jgi:hypothetical protein